MVNRYLGYLLLFIVLFACAKVSLLIEGDGVFVDPRDGGEYPFALIGNQTWMIRNMNYETGDSWWYSDDESFGKDFGRLYSWQSALKACPNGWHLPTDLEWKKLEISQGMDIYSADSSDWRRSGAVAIPLKHTAGWFSGGTGTNDSRFTALPGGFRSTGEQFVYKGDIANYWTSSYTSETHAWGRALIYYEAGVYRWKYDKEEGFTVRCLKD